MEKAIGEWRFAYQAWRMAMLIGNVHPSTIEGVKSLAVQYRKQRGIKHSAALDLAAKAANCANYKHALRVLPVRGRTQEISYTFLTVYWCDKKNGYKIGRETLKIELRKPLLEICRKLQFKKVRGFELLRMVALDHFVCDAVCGSQTQARATLMTAERSLRFMEYTGLSPVSDSRKVDRARRLANNLPNCDHATNWLDPTTGHFIRIDEPYGNAPDEAKRAVWAESTGWSVVKTSWPGMYFPYHCDLYVVTDARTGYDVDALVAKINSMPPPLIEEEWCGDSSSSWETFTSPMAKTPQDTRRARCRGMIYPKAAKATLPYNYNMGTDRRRPAGAMSVESHIEVDSIIKAIIRSIQCSSGVFRQLNSVRSTLEDWMGIEIGRDQLSEQKFFDVYYRDTKGDARNRNRAQSSVEIVKMLGEIKQKLQVAYPDCAPLRLQLRKIDLSVMLMSRMKAEEK